jgi:hypothetical protein
MSGYALLALAIAIAALPTLAVTRIPVLRNASADIKLLCFAGIAICLFPLALFAWLAIFFQLFGINFLD